MKIIYSLIFTILFIFLLQGIGWGLMTLNLYSMFSTRLTQFTITLAFILIFRKPVLKKLLVYEEKYIIWGIILGLLYPYFQWLLSIPYYFDIPETTSLFSFDFGKILELQIVPALILASVSEELFFKIAIQNELTKKHSPFISIGVTALLFSLIHLTILAIFVEHIGLTFYIAYSAFLGGIISAILFHKSKSLVPSIVFHISWNLMIQIMS